MAHSIVPRREPCFNCNNPVFFAERLVINSILYHRSCFRCARCHSTLTLGNFYETETENEFCCETCPDEEKKYRSSDELSQSDDLGSISDMKDTSSVNDKCDDEFEELYRQTQEEVDDAVVVADVKTVPSFDNNNSDRLEKSGSNNSVEHASELLPEKLLKVHLNEETIKDNENEISKQPAGSSSDVVVSLKQDENLIAPQCDSAVKNDEEIESHSIVENQPTSENSENSIAVVQENELIETSNLVVVAAAARDESQLSNNDECAAAVDNDKLNVETNESENNDTHSQHEHEHQHDVINNSESDTRKCDKKPIPKPRSLNPFGEFDDEESDNVSITSSQKQYKKELNPFGSDDDDDEQSQQVSRMLVGANSSLGTSSLNLNHKKPTDLPSKFYSTKKKRAPKPPTPRLSEVFSQAAAPVEVIDMKKKQIRGI